MNRHRRIETAINRSMKFVNPKKKGARETEDKLIITKEKIKGCTVIRCVTGNAILQLVTRPRPNLARCMPSWHSNPSSSWHWFFNFYLLFNRQTHHFYYKEFRVQNRDLVLFFSSFSFVLNVSLVMFAVADKLATSKWKKKQKKKWRNNALFSPLRARVFVCVGASGGLSQPSVPRCQRLYLSHKKAFPHLLLCFFSFPFPLVAAFTRYCNRVYYLWRRL